jgi:hypothetical protein
MFSKPVKSCQKFSRNFQKRLEIFLGLRRGKHENMRKEEGVPNGTHESVPNGIGEEGSTRTWEKKRVFQMEQHESVPNGIGEEGRMRKEEGVPNGTARKCSKWNRRRGKHEKRRGS